MIRRALIRALLIGGGAYLGAALLLWTLRFEMIYPFDPAPTSPQAAGVAADVAMLPVPGAAPLPVWTRQPDPGRPVVLYFMGNGGSLRFFVPRLAFFAAQGWGYAAMPYRGGGGVAGQPREATLKRDAAALYAGLDALMEAPVPETRRVIFGTSLGTGIAAWLAVDRAPGAVVLEAPFTRLCDAAQDAYPVFPACLIMQDEQYDTAALIDRITAPVLMVHGDQDAVIPVEHARRLKTFAPNAELRVLGGGGHNNLRQFGLEGAITTFLADRLNETPRKGRPAPADR